MNAILGRRLPPFSSPLAERINVLIALRNAHGDKDLAEASLSISLVQDINIWPTEGPNIQAKRSAIKSLLANVSVKDGEIDRDTMTRIQRIVDPQHTSPPAATIEIELVDRDSLEFLQGKVHLFNTT